MSHRLRAALVAAALALGAGAAYAPIAQPGAGWVFDDHNLVKPSPALEGLAGLRRAISTDLYRQATPRLEASPYWRPLALASFWLDARLGDVPRALHVGNLVLHALATALLALVMMRRHGGAAGLVAAASAAAWWAFHPENVEAVAWISCRYELLTGVALIGLLALPWRPGPLRAALHGLVFLAGLLSKDAFAVLAAVVVADDFAERRPMRAAALRWGAVVAAIASWWGARSLLGIRSMERPGPAELVGIVLRYFDAARIYLVRALVPPPLTISHLHEPGGALAIAAGAAIVIGLAGAAIWRRRLAVPVAIFLAGLVPIALAMARFGETPERYLYVPSIGLALLLGELIALGFGARQLLARWSAPALVGLATLVGLIRLERRLPEWGSDEVVWAAALRVDPLDPQANFELGRQAGRRRDWAEARRALELAARGNPRSGRIAAAYAWALLGSRDAPAALQQAERATRLAPFEPDGWLFLAGARHESGDHAGELAAIDELLKLSPEYPGMAQRRAIAACEASGEPDCDPGRGR